MNKKFISKVVFIFSIFTMICLSSCSEIVDESNKETGNFTFYYPGANPELRLLNPEFNPNEINSYHVIIQDDDFVIYEFDLTPENLCKNIEDLRICQYLIKVYGYNQKTSEEKKLCAYGEKYAVPLPDGVSPSDVVSVAKKFGYDVKEEDVQNNVSIDVYPLIENFIDWGNSKLISDTIVLDKSKLSSADSRIYYLEEIQNCLKIQIVYNGGYKEVFTINEFLESDCISSGGYEFEIYNLENEEWVSIYDATDFSTKVCYSLYKYDESCLSIMFDIE